MYVTFFVTSIFGVNKTDTIPTSFTVNKNNVDFLIIAQMQQFWQIEYAANFNNINFGEV